MKWVLIGFGLAVIAGAIYVRSASHDLARWHVDPSTVTGVQERNQYRDDVFVDLPPGDVFDEFTIDAYTRRIKPLAFDEAGMYATYVVRSRWLGYPDYVTVKSVPEGAGSQVTILSRSRFGYSDLGANKARVEAWFERLKAAASRSRS